MADYFTQLVVQQDIPGNLIAPHEKLLLEQILDANEQDGAISYCSSEGPGAYIWLNREAVKRALAAPRVRSRLRKPLLQRYHAAPSDKAEFEFDLTTTAYGSDVYLIILQDVVRRARDTLPYITIAASFTCNKMRKDGFGGMALILTPARILFQSTNDYLEKFIGRSEKKHRAAPPP
ncbi:MAG: hypothetical protein ACLP02_18810 [Rhodomicrobium sp.]